MKKTIIIKDKKKAKEKKNINKANFFIDLRNKVNKFLWKTISTIFFTVIHTVQPQYLESPENRKKFKIKFLNYQGFDQINKYPKLFLAARNMIHQKIGTINKSLFSMFYQFQNCVIIQCFE